MSFPQSRPRRLRHSPALRELVAEVRLGVSDLVAPLFVREGITSPQPISSLAGVDQHTIQSLKGVWRSCQERRRGLGGI
jgi:porphobilinogen synthase